jgi:LysM repeat protein
MARRILALIVLAAAAWAFTFGQSAIASNTPGTASSFTYVTVSAGDTLWSLAETYASEEDARDWIQDLASLNALETAEIYPGQQLALPQR